MRIAEGWWTKVNRLGGLRESDLLNDVDAWTHRRLNRGPVQQTEPRKEPRSMLVLSRQRDEAIMIGDAIEITVVDIRGDKVRLGIAAPRQVQVHRKEVFDAIRRENTAASQIHIADLQHADRSLRRLGPGTNQVRPQAV